MEHHLTVRTRIVDVDGYRGDEIGLKRKASPRGEAVKLSLTDEV